MYRCCILLFMYWLISIYVSSLVSASAHKISNRYKNLRCLTYPNNMVHAVNVTITNVDPDGSEGEAILLSRAMDGNGRTQHTDCWEEVSAGWGVARRWIGGERVGRHGAGQRREAAMLLHYKIRRREMRHFKSKSLLNDYVLLFPHASHLTV